MKTDLLTTPSIESVGREEARGIKPMPLWQAALFFGIPAVLFALNYRLIAVVGLSRNSLTLSAVGLLGPYVLLAVASLVAYRMEGNAWGMDELKERFRLHRVTGGTWLLAAILLVLSLLANWLLVAIRQMIFSPTGIPDMGFAVDVVSGNGKWLVLLGMLTQVIFNVVGEEMWWRGYILPRQELVHGKYTWLIHGTLWTLFHVYQWWDLAALLPVCLAIAYLAQRSKSIWPGLAVHFGFNSIDLGLLIVYSP